MLKTVESSEFNMDMMNDSSESINVASSLGILSESMFLTRIVDVDYYQSFPCRGFDACFSDFRGCEIYKIPVIRIFGTTPAGQKTCLHVHGIFPYLSIKCEDNMPRNASDGIFRKYTQELALSIDKAINIASRKSNSSQHHVYKIVMITGIPFYGYHEKEQPFLRIYFYNPNVISKAAELLAAGAVMNRVMQPHEAHISYILQFLIDYKLFGMNFIGLKKVTFRTGSDEHMPVGSPAASAKSSVKQLFTTNAMTKIWCKEAVNSPELCNKLKKQTSCELEVDCSSDDILNRLERKLSECKNPGLLAIWEEERERRRQRGESSQITPASSQERPKASETESELFYKEKLKSMISLGPRKYRGKGKNSYIEVSGESSDDPSSQKSETENISFSDTQDKEVLSAFLSMANESNFDPDQDSILSSQPFIMEEDDEAETTEMSQQIFENADDWQYSPLFGVGRSEEQNKMSDDDDVPLPDICIPQLDGTDDSIMEQVPKKQPVPIPPQQFFSNSNKVKDHPFNSGPSAPGGMLMKSISSNLSRKKNRSNASDQVSHMTSPQTLTAVDIFQNISSAKMETDIIEINGCANNLSNHQACIIPKCQQKPEEKISKEEPIVIRPPFRKRKELFNLHLSPVNSLSTDKSNNDSVMQPKLTLKWRRKQLYSDDKINAMAAASEQTFDQLLDSTKSVAGNSSPISACDKFCSSSPNKMAQKPDSNNIEIEKVIDDIDRITVDKSDKSPKQENLENGCRSSTPSSPSLKMKFKFKKVKTRSKESRIYVVEKEYNHSVDEPMPNDLSAPKVKLKLVDIPYVNHNNDGNDERLSFNGENVKKKFTTSRMLMTSSKNENCSYRCPVRQMSDSSDCSSSCSDIKPSKKGVSLSRRKKSKIDNSSSDTISKEHPADMHDKRLSQLNLVLMRDKSDGFHCINSSERISSNRKSELCDSETKLPSKKKSKLSISGQSSSDEAHNPPKKSKHISSTSFPVEQKAESSKEKYRLPKLHLKLTNSDKWTACSELTDDDLSRKDSTHKTHAHNNEKKSKKKPPSIKIVLPRCSPSKNLHKSCSESFVENSCEDTEVIAKATKEKPEASCKPCYVRLVRVSDKVMKKYENSKSSSSETGEQNCLNNTSFNNSESQSMEKNYSEQESHDFESQCPSYELCESAFSPDEPEEQIDVMWNLSYFSPPRNDPWTLNSPPSCWSPNPDNTDFSKSSFESKSGEFLSLASRIKIESEDSLDMSSASNHFDSVKGYIKDEFIVKSSLPCIIDNKCFSPEKSVCSCHSMSDFKSFLKDRDSKEIVHKIWCSSYPGAEKPNTDCFSRNCSPASNQDIDQSLYKPYDIMSFHNQRNSFRGSQMSDKSCKSSQWEDSKLLLSPPQLEFNGISNHLLLDQRQRFQEENVLSSDSEPKIIQSDTSEEPRPQDSVHLQSSQKNSVSFDKKQDSCQETICEERDVPSKKIEDCTSQDSTSKSDSTDYFSILPSTQLSLYSMLEDDDDDAMQDTRNNLYLSSRSIFGDGVGEMEKRHDNLCYESNSEFSEHKSDHASSERSTTPVYEGQDNPGSENMADDHGITDLVPVCDSNFVPADDHCNEADSSDKICEKVNDSVELHAKLPELSKPEDSVMDFSSGNEMALSVKVTYNDKTSQSDATDKSCTNEVTENMSNSNKSVLSIDQILHGNNNIKKRKQNTRAKNVPTSSESNNQSSFEKTVTNQEKAMPQHLHLTYNSWRSQPVTTPASVLAPKLTELLNSGPRIYNPVSQNCLTNAIFSQDRSLDNNILQERIITKNSNPVQLNIPFLPGSNPLLGPHALSGMNAYLPQQNQIVVLPEVADRNRDGSVKPSNVIFPTSTGIVQLSPVNLLTHSHNNSVVPLNIPVSTISNDCVPIIESSIPVTMSSEFGEKFLANTDEHSNKSETNNDEGDILSKLVRSCDIDMEFEAGQDVEEGENDSPSSIPANSFNIDLSGAQHNPCSGNVDSENAPGSKHGSYSEGSSSSGLAADMGNAFIQNENNLGAFSINASTTVGNDGGQFIGVQGVYEERPGSVGSSSSGILPSPLIPVEFSSDRGQEVLDQAGFPIRPPSLRSNENSFLLDSPGIHSFYGDETIYGFNSSIDLDAQNNSMWSSNYADDFLNSEKQLDIRGSVSSAKMSHSSKFLHSQSQQKASSKFSQSRKSNEYIGGCNGSGITRNDILDKRLEKIVKPKQEPPSREEIITTANIFGLPEEKHVDAFYSNSFDADGKFGDVVHAAKTYNVSMLPDFESYLLPSKYGCHNDSSMLKAFQSSGSFNILDEIKKDPKLKVVMSGNRHVLLSPSCFAPSMTDVKKWLTVQQATKAGKNEQVSKSNSNKNNCGEDTLKNECVLDQEVEKLPLIMCNSIDRTEIVSRSPIFFGALDEDNKSLNSINQSRLSKKNRHKNIPLSSTPVHMKISEHRDESLVKILMQTQERYSSSPPSDKTLNNSKVDYAFSPVNTANLSPSKKRKLHFENEEIAKGARMMQSEMGDIASSMNSPVDKIMLISMHNSTASNIDGPTLCNTGNFRFNCGNLDDAHDSHENQHLTVMSIEIHVNTRNELNPNPIYDPVSAVFFAVSRDDDDEPNNQSVGVIAVEEFESATLQNCGSKLSDLQKELNSTSGISQNLIFCVNNELELFEQLSKVTSHFDPDILVGYEIQKLSLGYLLQRAAYLNIDLRTKISRLLESESSNSALHENLLDDQSNVAVDQSIDNLHIVGRIVLNLWRLMRKELTLNIYTFENVYYHVVHKRTPLYAFHTLTQWYTDKHQLQRWRVFAYYVVRVAGNLQLIDHLNIVGQTSEFARVFGIQFYDVLNRGSQFRVESMMLRVAKPLSYIPVSPTVQQRSRARAPECVPLIFEPESRFYVDPVLVLDFQSLYPSMMIAYNYCFSTCLGRIEHFEKTGSFDFGSTTLTIGKDLLRKLGNNIHISPTGIAFVKSNIRKGVLPMMVEEILNTRVMVKQSLKMCKSNKALSRILEARQLGLKLIANVTYGYTGANFSGRMSCVEVADSIVGKGRETLERAIHLIEQSEEWNAKVVYGDTDSVFVLLPGRSKEQAFKIGQDIADAVTALNPKPVKLKFEKVYLPCILQTKKRYVGYMYETIEQDEPVFDAKGIETVRRDTCAAAAKILEKSLKVLFNSRDVSLVKKYVQKQFEKLLSGRINIIDCVFAKEYRGRSGYRPGACVPALEIAKKRLLVDPRSEPCVGERVPYVVVYGFPGLPVIQLVREPLELLKDPSLRVNAKYYISRVIMPPLDRALSLIGVDVNNWYNSVSHMHVPSLPMVPTTATTAKPKGTLSQYFTALSCPSCEQPTNYGLCSGCHQDAQGTAVVLNDKIRLWERKYNHLKKICSSCSKNNGSLESCISIDCPILFKLHQAQKEVSQAPYLRNLLLHELF